MSILSNILIVLIIYLVYLLVWFILNLLAYFLSLVFKTKKILGFFVGAAAVLYYIFTFLLGLYLLWIIISLLLSGLLLWFFIMLFFGIFVIYGIVGFLQAPFVLIPTYFLEKIEKANFGENIVVGEILDKDNKIIDVSEGETSLKIRFAKYFLAIYALNLTSLIIFPVEREGLAPFDFITKPFFQIISLTLIVGIPYGISRKIKRKAFFTKDKRYFLIKTWKIALYIFIPLSVIVYLLYLGNS